MYWYHGYESTLSPSSLSINFTKDFLCPLTRLVPSSFSPYLSNIVLLSLSQSLYFLPSDFPPFSSLSPNVVTPSTLDHYHCFLNFWSSVFFFSLSPLSISFSLLSSSSHFFSDLSILHPHIQHLRESGQTLIDSPTPTLNYNIHTLSHCPPSLYWHINTYYIHLYSQLYPCWLLLLRLTHTTARTQQWAHLR